MAEEVDLAKFYYAYCETEAVDLGGPTSDKTVADNRAAHHKDETGHKTRVDYREPD